MKDESQRWVWARAAAFAALLVCTSPGWADVIWVGSGAGRGFRQEVDIVDVEDNQLIYLVNGNRASSPLVRIQQMELTGEPAFNQAEQAFAAGEWATAADAYVAYAKRHAKPWVRRRAAERLILAAGRSGRFDQSVTGFIQLTVVAPEAAVGREPVFSEKTEAVQLERAAAELQKTLDDGVSPAQSRPLLALLLALHNRRGDAVAAGTVVERLGRVMGPDSAQLDPELYAQVLLGRATLALSRGEGDQAVSFVEQGRKLFTDPRQQSDAVMILARVQEQRAGERREGLMDAALAYMKVVAHFKRDPEAPNVPEALLRAGQIHEKLALPEAATALYRDLVEAHPDSSWAAEAQKRLNSLGN